MGNRYLAGAYAIGALPVGKTTSKPSLIATRPAPPAAPRPSAPPPAAPPPANPPVARPSTPVTRPAPAAPKPAPKPSTSPATKAKMTAAAGHAASAADKLARRHPGMSGALRRISSSMASKAQAIKGDGIIGSVIGWFVGDDSADAQQATSADIAAQAGDIAVQIYNTLDALSAAGKTDLMHEGESLINSCNYIVTELDQMIRSNSSM